MSLASFVAAHGATTAVLSYVGRRGVRAVLVGTDGAWGDHLAADEPAARAACEAAGITIAAGWGRELSEAVRTGRGEWARMGGRLAS